MASANNQTNLNNLNVVDLDYNNLKTSFKNFLRGQSQFKDYDFDGPNIATLLRLLAYNTYINAFYTNMALAEAHLDSAQLRSSIISHAKDLNYTPRSKRSAVARISCSFEATGVSQPYTLPKGSTFSSVVKNTSYTFSLPETITISSANTSFSFESDIYEGFFVKDSYIAEGNDNERFRLTNKNVDTRSLTVVVYEDGSSVGENYIYKQNLLDLDSESKVFFLQMAQDNYYEVLFGDNIIGRKPKTGSTVVLDYRITQGPEADGAKRFGIDFDPTGAAEELTSTPVVETIITSHNGQDEESDESIRYFAPRNFQVQERTVIDNDYAIALKTAFPEINVVHAYGGEEENPPRMGKVLISVDLNNVDGLPENKKREYERFLKRRSPFGIDPIFVEPQYLYLNIDSLIRYDVNIATNSPERLKSLVSAAIIAYRDNFLNDFNVTFRNSIFSRLIDNSDKSIISNITEIKMYKILVPTIEVSRNYIVDFGIAIRNTLPVIGKSHFVGREHAVKSDPFQFNGQTVTMEDTGPLDGSSFGYLRLIKENINQHIEIARIGTVDYINGIININDLNIQSYTGTGIKIFALPKDKDIQSKKNTILTIDPNRIILKTEEYRSS